MIAQFNRFEIKMTMAQAHTGSHPGACDNDVEYLLTIPVIQRELRRIPDGKLADELDEYGAWDDEQLKDRKENEKRIVWIAAGNITEMEYQKKNKEGTKTKSCTFFIIFCTRVQHLVHTLFMLSKYNEDIVNELCESLRKLSGRVQACKQAGVCYDTFLGWMKKYPEFVERVKKAERESRKSGKERAIACIFKAMEKSWQAGAWWLERNYPDQYGRRDPVFDGLKKLAAPTININNYEGEKPTVPDAIRQALAQTSQN